MIEGIPAVVSYQTRNDDDRFHTRYQVQVTWRSPDSGIENQVLVGPETFGGEAAMYRAKIEELLLIVYRAGMTAGAEQAVDDLLRK